MAVVGSQTKLRELFTQVADGAINLPSASATMILIETITASQHSYYLVSIVPTNLNIVADVFQTTGSVPAMTTVVAGVNAAILKRRTISAPDTLDIFLYMTSNIDMLPIKYRVYKIAGLV